MFNIGGPELILIVVLALLIFGPKRLPQLGRTLGKGMAEFRRASTELQRAFNTELEDPPPRAAGSPYAPHSGPRPEPRTATALAAPATTIDSPAGGLASDEVVPVEDTPADRPVWEPVGTAEPAEDEKPDGGLA
jgi:sec-independent protein translocase protein TatA